MKPKYDVVILGAGHNGLVAAAYLARAGLSVLLLEKNDYIGGATTSQKVFPDYDAYLYWHANAEGDPANQWLRNLVRTTFQPNGG